MTDRSLTASEKPSAKRKPSTRNKTSRVGKRANNAPNAPRQPAKEPATKAEPAAESRVSSTTSAQTQPAKQPATEGSSKRPEAKLTEEARHFVVTSLACFDTPKIVVAAVKEHFAIEITPQAVEAYNPGRAAGTGLSEKWKALFYSAREAFLKDDAEIAIAHRNVRLRALNRMASKAESQGNLGLAKEIHRQAAEEKGEVYTNARVLKGAGENGAHLVEAVRGLFGEVDGATRTLTHTAESEHAAPQPNKA